MHATHLTRPPARRKEKQRADLYLRIIRDLCRARCYTQRIAFAELAQHLVRRFSSRWVKEYVFDMCIELLYDPVPNVRIVVTSVMPGLKQCIRLPEDVDLLERLNSAMSNTMTDNDRDVSQVGARGRAHLCCTDGRSALASRVCVCGRGGGGCA